LDYTASIAGNNKCDLVLVSIVPELTPLAPTSTRCGDLRKLQIDVEKIGKNMLQTHADRIEEKYSNSRVKPVVKAGGIKRNIIDVSNSVAVDLIVVRNKDKGEIASWMLGSVSRDIVESCIVPVLVVKDRKYCEIPS
jgi:nucleotide-binding universal stress UspA family protein